MSSTSGRDTAGGGRDTAGGGQETGNRKRETEPARKRGGRGEQRATGNGTKVRWVNSGRLGWPIECDQRAGRFATFIVPRQRQFNEFPIHDQRLAVVTASTTRERAFPTEQRSWTMLISDLVPLAMDGLSVALACNACSPWNSGAWDSRFEVRDQKKIRDLRFEVSKETTVGTLKPITKKRPNYLPRCLSPHRCQLAPSILPPFSPFFLRQSCASSTNLLSTISPSNLQAQRLLHSPSAAFDPMSAPIPAPFYFLPLEINGAIWKSRAGSVHPLTPSVPVLRCIVAEA